MSIIASMALGLTAGPRLLISINTNYPDGRVETIGRPRHATQADLKAYQGYALNHRIYWAVTGSRSWNLALFQ